MQVHEQEILAVAFNPTGDNHLVTGSADKVKYNFEELSVGAI